MPVLKTYINGSWQNVSGFGNNADTLDGKHASEFASATDVKALQTKIDNIEISTNDFAPTDHASPDTTYGIGTSDNYGHIKLSDATDSISGTGDGVAATPAAVKAAYDLANGNHSHSAMTGATSAKAGTAGFVPAPSAGKQTAFLRGDGTWATPESDGGVFVVEFDTATFAQIEAAVAAGKVVVCDYSEEYEGDIYHNRLPLFEFVTGDHYSFVHDDNDYGLWACIYKDNSWEDDVYNPNDAVSINGTFGNKTQANRTAMATLSDAQLRDIYAGTSDLTAGTSSLTSGTLYFVYE